MAVALPMPFTMFSDVLAGLTCALALGGAVFFTTVFAPSVFRELPHEVARPFLLALLPDYYLLLAALTGASAMLLWRQAESSVLALVCVMFVFVRYALLPRLERARENGSAGDTAEATLYRQLHMLNRVIATGQTTAVALVLARILSGRMDG